jgi:hypothetical protein
VVEGGQFLDHVLRFPGAAGFGLSGTRPEENAEKMGRLGERLGGRLTDVGCQRQDESKKRQRRMREEKVQSPCNGRRGDVQQQSPGGR